MKKSYFIIFFIFGILFSNCKKEDELVVTTIEGRLINQETQLPIEGETMELHERTGVSGLSYIIKTTKAVSDENGNFKFNYTEKSDFENTLILSASIELELQFSKALINGIEENLFFIDGKTLQKGQSYYFEIELVP